jgi:hypothetical protein
MTAREMIIELTETRCCCGEPKPVKRSFCPRCYYVLPHAMRKNLYNRIGEGYETAYLAARNRLGFKVAE